MKRTMTHKGRVALASGIFAFALAPALVGCEDDGAEEVVDEAGDAVEDAGDEVEDALDG